MSDDVATILKHQEALASERTNIDSWRQQIGYRVLPAEAQFTTEGVEGQKRLERLFDSTAATDCERFAAVMEDLLTPRSQMWHGLKPDKSELAESQAVKEYFEQATKVLFAMRYRPKANFAAQKHQGYLSLGAFGDSCLFVDEEVGYGPRYQQWHMSEVFWAEDQYGAIDTLYRRYKMTGKKAFQRFGDKLPPKILQTVQDRPFDKHEFIHCVRPNSERVEGRLDYRGMPWSSYYIAVEAKSMLDVGGYTSWPFAIGRYMVATGEKHGRSPAMACWPAIMTLQEEKKTILRAGQKEVDPPILLSEDGALEPFNMRPGALNHGMVNDQGQALAQPLKIGANIPLGLELMGLESKAIDDSFLVTIFQILTENPQMTATQVLEIAQQKGMMLAPTMGRQHSEDLGPLIARELDIASKAGLLPEMPEELLEAGGEYQVEYSSPLARAMRAQDALAITRMYEILPSAIAIDPNAAYVMDVPASVREVAEISGVPAKLMRDQADVDKIVSDKAEAENQAQQVAMAPEMSTAALNAAKAESLRMGGAG